MRKLEKKMVEWLDEKLAKDPAAQEAIKNKQPTAIMLAAAKACVGIREQGGNNKGPLVSLMQDTVGGPDPWAWCMSFVQTCVAYAELKSGRKSPLAASEHCMSVWNANKLQRETSNPSAGSIVIWQKGDTQSGHTAFFVGLENGEMSTVEGNTESGIGASGKVERDGGGVYECRRSIKGTPSMRVLGFIKPF